MRLLGEALALSDQDQETLHWAAVLHDIGKVALDPGLLAQKDALSNEEWVALRRHPEIGYHITNNVAELAEVAVTILAHHEWWDGGGYPKGLVGQKIPLLARIIGLAEAYDAMLTDQPYRPALSTSQAVAAIVAGSGTQFDPTLAAVFIDQVIGESGLL